MSVKPVDMTYPEMMPMSKKKSLPTIPAATLISRKPISNAALNPYTSLRKLRHGTRFGHIKSSRGPRV